MKLLFLVSTGLIFGAVMIQEYLLAAVGVYPLLISAFSLNEDPS